MALCLASSYDSFVKYMNENYDLSDAALPALYEFLDREFDNFVLNARNVKYEWYEFDNPVDAIKFAIRKGWIKNDFEEHYDDPDRGYDLAVKALIRESGFQATSTEPLFVVFFEEGVILGKDVSRRSGNCFLPGVRK